MAVSYIVDVVSSWWSLSCCCWRRGCRVAGNAIDGWVAIRGAHSSSMDRQASCVVSRHVSVKLTTTSTKTTQPQSSPSSSPLLSTTTNMADGNAENRLSAFYHRGDTLLAMLQILQIRTTDPIPLGVAHYRTILPEDINLAPEITITLQRTYIKMDNRSQAPQEEEEQVNEEVDVVRHEQSPESSSAALALVKTQLREVEDQLTALRTRRTEIAETRIKLNIARLEVEREMQVVQDEEKGLKALETRQGDISKCLLLKKQSLQSLSEFIAIKNDNLDERRNEVLKLKTTIQDQQAAMTEKKSSVAREEQEAAKTLKTPSDKEQQQSPKHNQTSRPARNTRSVSRLTREGTVDDINLVVGKNTEHNDFEILEVRALSFSSSAAPENDNDEEEQEFLPAWDPMEVYTAPENQVKSCAPVTPPINTTAPGADKVQSSNYSWEPSPAPAPPSRNSSTLSAGAPAGALPQVEVTSAVHAHPKQPPPGTSVLVQGSLASNKRKQADDATPPPKIKKIESPASKISSRRGRHRQLVPVLEEDEGPQTPIKPQAAVVKPPAATTNTSLLLPGFLDIPANKSDAKRLDIFITDVINRALDCNINVIYAGGPWGSEFNQKRLVQAADRFRKECLICFYLGCDPVPPVPRSMCKKHPQVNQQLRVFESTWHAPMKQGCVRCGFPFWTHSPMHHGMTCPFNMLGNVMGWMLENDGGALRNALYQIPSIRTARKIMATRNGCSVEQLDTRVTWTKQLQTAFNTEMSQDRRVTYSFLLFTAWFAMRLWRTFDKQGRVRLTHLPDINVGDES